MRISERGPLSQIVLGAAASAAGAAAESIVAREVNVGVGRFR